MDTATRSRCNRGNIQETICSSSPSKPWLLTTPATSAASSHCSKRRLRNPPAPACADSNLRPRSSRSSSKTSSSSSRPTSQWRFSKATTAWVREAAPALQLTIIIHPNNRNQHIKQAKCRRIMRIRQRGSLDQSMSILITTARLFETIKLSGKTTTKMALTTTMKHWHSTIRTTITTTTNKNKQQTTTNRCAARWGLAWLRAACSTPNPSPQAITTRWRRRHLVDKLRQPSQAVYSLWHLLMLPQPRSYSTHRGGRTVRQ